jgi:hypothetical protein
MDMSIAYALVGGSWVTLKSRFAVVLARRTERELALAREEWLRRRSQVDKTRLTETAFVKFLIELDETEALLVEQLRANAERASLGAASPGGDDDEDGGTSDDSVGPESGPDAPLPGALEKLTDDDLFPVEIES